LETFVLAPQSTLLYFPTMTISDDVRKPFNKTKGAKPGIFARGEGER